MPGTGDLLDPCIGLDKTVRKEPIRSLVQAATYELQIICHAYKIHLCLCLPVNFVNLIKGSQFYYPRNSAFDLHLSAYNVYGDFKYL